MKKQILPVILAAAAAMTIASCGTSDSETSSDKAVPSANNSASSLSSHNSETESLSDSDSGLTSASDTSSQSDEKVYTITGGYENSWDISDKETIAQIDKWLEKVSAVCKDYELKEGDFPRVGGTLGYIIKTDGDNYEKMYFITTSRLDLSQYTEKKYERQENFTVNYKPYELPWDYIDSITEIIENSKK